MSAFDPPPLDRTYTDQEIKAFITISTREWNQVYRDKRGPAWYGGGPGWPAELRRKAAEMERLAPIYRLAADAMEREGCRE